MLAPTMPVKEDFEKKKRVFTLYADETIDKKELESVDFTYIVTVDGECSRTEFIKNEGVDQARYDKAMEKYKRELEKYKKHLKISRKKEYLKLKKEFEK